MSNFKFYYLLYVVLIFAPALIECKKNKDDIKTIFYVRHSEPIVINNTSEQSPAKKNFVLFFNPQQQTKIIIHGWRSTLNKTNMQELIKAYRDTAEHNVIGIDWKAMTYKVYTTTLTYLDDVGEYVADLINFLVDNLHTHHDRIHIIGHSLGAHAAGLAGNRLHIQSGNKIARITGLDPASPGIYPVYCLGANDAQFVDVIHTAAGVIGIVDNIGHVDFYPNNGKSNQPGCNLPNCSHRRAVAFFTESIYSPNRTFLSYKCDSWKSYKKGDCFNTEPIQMGENVDRNASGKYYLRTKSEPPYSRTRIID